jgi:ubiquinol-cytochrome c reductase cytochrome b subunit
MAPADPTSGFQARPAWYFLFLYKLRMLFEGPLEPVATMVLPGAAAGFLVAIPFIDQYGGKAGRALVLIGFGALAMGVMAMTAVAITSDRANEDYQKAVKLAHKNAARALDLAKTGVQAQGGLAVFWNDPEYKVKMLYKEHCQNCHAIDGEGGDEAPNLTDYSSRAWLTALVRNPNDPRFFGGTKHDSMDPYPEKDLPQEQLDAAVEYVVSLMGDPSMQVDDTLAATGKTLWEDELDCNSCHEVEAGEDGDGPNLLGHGSSAWAARVIRDSSKPDLFGEAAQMPKFGDKLSDEQIEQLAAFVVSQRAAKPADDEEAEAEETTPEENGAEAEPEEAEPVEAEPEAAEPEEAEPED